MLKLVLGAGVLLVAIVILLIYYRPSIEYAYVSGPIAAPTPTAAPVASTTSGETTPVRSEPTSDPSRASTPEPTPISNPSNYPGLELPQQLNNAHLAIPESLRHKRTHGGVIIVEGVVSSSGSVQHLTVLKSAHPELNELAVAATQKLRFKPAVLNGRAVPVRMVWVHRLEVR